MLGKELPRRWCQGARKMTIAAQTALAESPGSAFRGFFYIIFTSIETPEGRSMLVSASITFGSGFKISTILL